MFGLQTNYIIGWFQNLVDLLNIWERSSLFDRVVINVSRNIKIRKPTGELIKFLFRCLCTYDCLPHV